MEMRLHIYEHILYRYSLSHIGYILHVDGAAFPSSSLPQ